MKKIMFNETYNLTSAVIAGTKLMTRRMIPLTDTDSEYLENAFDWDLPESVIIDRYAKYKVGEVVAIAQSYKDAGYTKEWVEQHIKPNPNAKPADPFEKKYPGWNNKMFVKAELMPHRILFTDLKVELLQDISDEDCFKEGIFDLEPYGIRPKFTANKLGNVFFTEKEAFAALIDKVSGKGTWQANLWVFAYNFELIK